MFTLHWKQNSVKFFLEKNVRMHIFRTLFRSILQLWKWTRRILEPLFNLLYKDLWQCNNPEPRNCLWTQTFFPFAHTVSPHTHLPTEALSLSLSLSHVHALHYLSPCYSLSAIYPTFLQSSSWTNNLWLYDIDTPQTLIAEALGTSMLVDTSSLICLSATRR